MKDWTEDDIKQMIFNKKSIEEFTAAELVELIYKSNEFANAFSVIEVPLNKELATRRSIGIDDIKMEIDLQSGIADSIYKFPVLRQRKDSFFQQPYFGASKPNAMPGRGFAWTVDYDLKEPLPFGIIEVDVFIRQETRRRGTGDLRHTADSMVYKETKVFYFDYSAGHYVQVDVKNTNNTNTKIYLERLEAIDHCYSLFEDENQDYVRMLQKLYEKMRKYMQNASPVMSSTNDYINDFKLFKPVLKKANEHLLMKLLYSHINIKEYKGLNNYLKNLILRIDEAFENLDELIDAFIKEHQQRTFKKGDDEKRIKALNETRNFILSDWKQGEEYFRLKKLTDEFKNLHNSLTEMVVSRNEDTSETMPTGYIINGKKLLPNLVTIEERYFLASYYLSEEKIKEREKLIINSLGSTEGTNLEEEQVEESMLDFSDNLITMDEFMRFVKEDKKTSLKAHILKELKRVNSSDKSNSATLLKYMNMFEYAKRELVLN